MLSAVLSAVLSDNNDSSYVSLMCARHAVYGYERFRTLGRITSHI